jgi:DNA-binding NarL/FixJ family response regulator
MASLIDGERARLIVVGTAASAEEALDRAHSLQPNVVVLDANLGDEDGLSLIPAILAAAPCNVVVVSSDADSRLAAHAARLGAVACLHKTASAAELLECIAAARPTSDRGIEGLQPASARNEGSNMHQVLNRIGSATGSLLRQEEGVTAIEYGLLAALIAVVCIGALSATGANLTAIYQFWSGAVAAAIGGAL